MTDRARALDILRWHLEAGVDETIGDAPVDRFAVSARPAPRPSAPQAEAPPPPPRRERPAPDLAMENPDEARAACESVLDSAPDHEGCRAGLLVIAVGTRDYEFARQLLLDNPKIQDEDARSLAETIADALEGKGDRHALAQQLMDIPYHAVFDSRHPGTVHDFVLPALILALGEPELAIERIALNARNEPKDVLDVIWDPQLDPIRCTTAFQQVAEQLNVVDQRAAAVCGK